MTLARLTKKRKARHHARVPKAKSDPETPATATDPATTVRIACEGAATVALGDLVGLQGNLKELTPENAAKLRRDICEQGFSEPIACWRQPDGVPRILNGHQRLRVLTEMAAEGWTVPPLPVSWVEAADEGEARRKVLSLGSSFGEVTEEGLRAFMLDSEFAVADVSAIASFPGIEFDSLFAQPAALGQDVGAQMAGLEYRVVVSCADEASQGALLERLTKEGLKCQPLIS